MYLSIYALCFIDHRPTLFEQRLKIRENIYLNTLMTQSETILYKQTFHHISSDYQAFHSVLNTLVIYLRNVLYRYIAATKTSTSNPTRLTETP